MHWPAGERSKPRRQESKRKAVRSHLSDLLGRLEGREERDEDKGKGSDLPTTQDPATQATSLAPMMSEQSTPDPPIQPPHELKKKGREEGEVSDRDASSGKTNSAQTHFKFSRTSTQPKLFPRGQACSPMGQTLFPTKMFCSLTARLKGAGTALGLALFWLGQA